MAALSDYISTTQFILHDANAQYFSVPLLTTCVNFARDRVVLDTNCLRANPLIPLNVGQEFYSFSTLTSAIQSMIDPNSGLAYPARNVAAILNINFVWSATQKVPLYRFSWSDLNHRYRMSPVQAFPAAFAMYDLKNFSIQPAISSTGFTMEVDCVWLPDLLANLTDVDYAMPTPLTELVPLMAAKWATYYQDDIEQSQRFMMDYEYERDKMVASLPPFTVEDWFAY